MHLIHDCHHDAQGRYDSTSFLLFRRRVRRQRLGLHRLQAGLYAGNVGSGRALEKAGYRRETVFACQLKNAVGAWEDHVWYSLLRDDWTA